MIKWLAILGALVALVTSCATPNVNPSQPRANTGYVDLYADAPDEFAWQVEDFDDSSQSFKRLFSDFEPPPGRILRLALSPGPHRLRVASMNYFTRGPAVVDVEVENGMVTPVHLSLIPEGTGRVERKEQQLRATAKGYYGRASKIHTDQSAIFRITAETSAPLPYQVKERTAYAR